MGKVKISKALSDRIAEVLTLIATGVEEEDTPIPYAVSEDSSDMSNVDWVCLFVSDRCIIDWKTKTSLRALWHEFLLWEHGSGRKISDINIAEFEGHLETKFKMSLEKRVFYNDSSIEYASNLYFKGIRIVGHKGNGEPVDGMIAAQLDKRSYLNLLKKYLSPIPISNSVLVGEFIQECCVTKADSIGIANLHELWTAFVFWQYARSQDEKRVCEISAVEFESILKGLYEAFDTETDLNAEPNVNGYTHYTSFRGIRLKPEYSVYPVSKAVTNPYSAHVAYSGQFLPKESSETARELVSKQDIGASLKELGTRFRDLADEAARGITQITDDELVDMFVKERCYFADESEVALGELWNLFSKWKPVYYKNRLSKIMFSKIVNQNYSLVKTEKGATDRVYFYGMGIKEKDGTGAPQPSDDELVRMFLKQKCYREPHSEIPLHKLWSAFREWKPVYYEDGLGRNRFSIAIAKCRGVNKISKPGMRVTFTGIGLEE